VKNLENRKFYFYFNWSIHSFLFVLLSIKEVDLGNLLDDEGFFTWRDLEVLLALDGGDWDEEEEEEEDEGDNGRGFPWDNNTMITVILSHPFSSMPLSGDKQASSSSSQIWLRESPFSILLLMKVTTSWLVIEFQIPSQAKTKNESCSVNSIVWISAKAEINWSFGSSSGLSLYWRSPFFLKKKKEINKKKKKKKK